MAGRALPRVRVVGGRLVIAYPTEVDAAMARDGVGPPPKGWGERQWWLRQMVAGTPLPAWAEALDLPPAQMVAMAAASPEPAIAVTAGWLDAVAHQRHGDWARALLAIGVTRPLLAVLPPAEADAVLVHRLAEGGLPSSLALLVSDRPASEALSRAVVAALARVVGSSGLREATAVRAELDRLGRWLAPEVAEDAAVSLAAALSDNAQVNRVFWERPLGTLMAMLDFRRSLHADLMPGAYTPRRRIAGGGPARTEGDTDV
jgi:hypothetical protein